MIEYDFFNLLIKEIAWSKNKTMSLVRFNVRKDS